MLQISPGFRLGKKLKTLYPQQPPPLVAKKHFEFTSPIYPSVCKIKGGYLYMYGCRGRYAWHLNIYHWSNSASFKAFIAVFSSTSAPTNSPYPPPTLEFMHTKLLLAMQMFGGESHGFAWSCWTIMQMSQCVSTCHPRSSPAWKIYIIGIGNMVRLSGNVSWRGYTLMLVWWGFQNCRNRMYLAHAYMTGGEYWVICVAFPIIWNLKRNIHSFPWPCLNYLRPANVLLCPITMLWPH